MSEHEPRILVTGGAGFIGSELVHQLADRFSDIVVIDNLSSGKAENLKHLSSDRVRLVVEDIMDRPCMEKWMQGVGTVFHLACRGLRHSLHSPVENHEVNATGTLNLLSAAKKASVQRFVYVSTSEVYGIPPNPPVKENHPTTPTTIYGASKLAGEYYTRIFHRTHDLPSVVVRPFNSFGPRCHHEGDSGEVIPRFMLRCMAGLPMVIFGDGRQTRDFTFVRDIARGILSAGFAEGILGETINLGSGKEISVRNLAREVAEATGNPEMQVLYHESRPGDVSRLVTDIGKAKRLLEFNPEISLKEGLIRMKEWYLSMGRSPEQLMEEEIEINWKPRSGAINA